MPITRRQLIILGGAGVVTFSVGGADRVLALIEGEHVTDLHVLLVDVSPSTSNARAAYLPDMLAFGAAAVHDRASLYADAWDGRPLASIGWKVQEDYGFPQYEGESHRLKRALARANEALEGELRPLLTVAPEVPGSPLLSALESVATLRASDRYRDQRGLKVLVATDAMIIGDDLDARDPIPDDARERMTRQWQKKLAPLRGAEVYFVGVGLGSELPPQRLSECHDVVDAVLTAVGAHLKSWGPRLGEAFPRYERGES